MRNSTRPVEYLSYKDAAASILGRHAGRTAIEMFGIDDLLREPDTADFTPAYAFLEAQGYQCAATPTLGWLGVAGLPGLPAIADLRDSLTFGFAAGTANLVVVPDISEDTRVAVDRAGLGLVLLVGDLSVRRHNLAVDGDDYLAMVDTSDRHVTIVLPEEELSELRAARLARIQLGIAAEILGICDRILTDAISYVSVRHQFGRRLSSFQSVQHLLAWAATERHQLTCLFDIAIAQAASGHLDPLLSQTVKAMAGRTVHTIIQTVTQVSGAISFTWEYSLNRPHRRALALDQIAGTSADLIVDLGRRLRIEGSVPDLISLGDGAC